MTGVPSNETLRLVKVLGAVGAKYAHDPRARRIFKAKDYERALKALGKCMTDGMDDVGGLDESEEVVMASEAHYKHLARENHLVRRTVPG